MPKGILVIGEVWVQAQAWGCRKQPHSETIQGLEGTCTVEHKIEAAAMALAGDDGGGGDEG